MRVCLPILPSITSLNILCRILCAAHFVFLLYKDFITFLSSSTCSRTSLLPILSVQFSYKIRLQHHISNAFILLISAFFNVHASQAYNSTLHTSVFTNRFSKERPIFFVKSSLLSANAIFASPILTQISFEHLPSSQSKPPKDLNFGTCSRSFPLTKMCMLATTLHHT